MTKESKKELTLLGLVFLGVAVMVCVIYLVCKWADGAAMSQSGISWQKRDSHSVAVAIALAKNGKTPKSRFFTLIGAGTLLAAKHFAKCLESDKARRHNEDLARLIARSAALRGDADAHFKLANLYLDPHDPMSREPDANHLAIKYLRLAADQGHVGARKMLEENEKCQLIIKQEMPRMPVVTIGPLIDNLKSVDACNKEQPWFMQSLLLWNLPFSMGDNGIDLWQSSH